MRLGFARLGVEAFRVQSLKYFAGDRDSGFDVLPRAVP